MGFEPKKTIRECDMLLDGKVTKTQDQLNRWLIVQIKALITRFTKGGL